MNINSCYACVTMQLCIVLCRPESDFIVIESSEILHMT